MKYVVLLTLGILLSYSPTSYAQAYFNKIYGSDTAVISYFSSIPIADGFIVAGFASGDNCKEYLCHRINQQGDIVWTTSYCEDNYSVYLQPQNWLQATLDGHFILAFTTYNILTNKEKAKLIKFSPEGVTLWQKGYEEAYNQTIRGILPLTNQHFLIWGKVDSTGLSNASSVPFIMEVDQEGNSQWKKTWPVNQESNIIAILSVLPVKNEDGYMAFCQRPGNYGPATTIPICLLRLDYFGNQKWLNEHSNRYQYFPNSFQQTENGDFIIGGLKNIQLSFEPPQNFLAKFNPQGYLVWEQTGFPPNDFSFLDMHIQADQSIVAVGTVQGVEGRNNTGGTIIHFDPNGQYIKHQFIPDYRNDPVAITGYIADIDVIPNTNNSSFLLTGYRLDNSIITSYFTQTGWIVRTDHAFNTCHTLNCDSVGDLTNAVPNTTVSQQTIHLKAYPNPTQQLLHISTPKHLLPQKQYQLTLQNMQGNMVYQVDYSPSISMATLTLPTHHLPNGIYYLRLQYEQQSIAQQKIIVLH